MTFKNSKSQICFALVLLIISIQSLFPTAKAQEALQISLEFDQTSTKSEVRFDVVINPSTSVGAFQAEYGYNPEYLQLKSISSNSGGEVYSKDENGTVGVIYMNKAPTSQRVLTLKFKVLKEGDSTVTAFYSEILSTDNSPLEFVNNNDCQVSVTSAGVTATTKAASKTSSSSSGKVSVIKDSKNGSPTVEKITESPGQQESHSFFSFQSQSPGFWALCGALITAAVVLIIFTSYKMGVKKMKSEKDSKENPPQENDDQTTDSY